MITINNIKKFLKTLFDWDYWHHLYPITGITPEITNRYKINRLGKILDVPRGKYLLVTPSNDYPTVILRESSGKVYKKRIHLLIAQIFLLKPSPEHTEVDHIDRNKNNYSIDNLHWVTPSENKKNRKFSEDSYKYYKVWVEYDACSSKILSGPISNKDFLRIFNIKDPQIEILIGTSKWKSFLTTEENLFDNFKFDTEWKLIPNSNNSYCSSQGLVFLTGRNTSPLITRGRLNDSGYRTVNIKKKILRVHRIVYYLFGTETFNLNSEMFIDHIDTNRSNNDISNLKVVKNQKENLSNPQTRINLGKAIIQLDLKGNKIAEFDSIVLANRFFGVTDNNSNIIRCCKGKQKTYKGYKWMYKEDYLKLKENETNSNLS